MSESASESWYLDAVVADQKAAVNRALVRRWADASRDGTVLKTDVFEEVCGRCRRCDSDLTGTQAHRLQFLPGQK